MRSTPLSKYVPALASWEPLDANDGRSFGFALLQARLRAEGWHLMYHNAVDHADAHPKPPPNLHSGRWQDRAVPSAKAPLNSAHEVKTPSHGDRRHPLSPQTPTLTI